MGRPNVFDDLLADLDAVPAAAVDNVVDRFHAVARELAAGAGMGRIGAALHSTPVDLAVSAGTATVTIVGAPAGLWVWVEDGTKAHWVAPRHASRNRHRRPAMTLPEHYMSRPVHVRGMTGQGLWTSVVDRVDNELVDLVGSAIDISVRG